MPISLLYYTLHRIPPVFHTNDDGWVFGAESPQEYHQTLDLDTKADILLKCTGLPPLQSSVRFQLWNEDDYIATIRLDPHWHRDHDYWKRSYNYRMQCNYNYRDACNLIDTITERYERNKDLKLPIKMESADVIAYHDPDDNLSEDLMELLWGRTQGSWMT